jgi:Zn-dependent peptidase ImmA (M78 family)
MPELHEEARLNPTNDGFSLWLRGVPKGSASLEREGKTAPARLRTTLAHELGHTFFFDVSVRPPRPFVTHLSLSDGEHGSNEEWWCMNFARAYLVPEFWVIREIRGRTLPSLRIAANLKIKLGVSWDLLFRRLIWDLKAWQNCVVFMAERSTLKAMRLWKSKELKNWKFSDWYEHEGKSLIASEASGDSSGREHSQEVQIQKLVRFRLSSLVFPGSKYLLCSLSPNQDTSLDRFAPNMITG